MVSTSVLCVFFKCLILNALHLGQLVVVPAFTAFGTALLQPHPLGSTITQAEATNDATIEGRWYLGGFILSPGTAAHRLGHHPGIVVTGFTHFQLTLKDARGQLHVISQHCD